MSKITLINAREILDSRGQPTIEACCCLAGGQVGKASVPAGASTGAHEAAELRDGDQSRYAGLGVLRAVGNINVEIHQHLQQRDYDQTTLDHALSALDGTPNKSRLGANAILAVSLAFARAAAAEQGLELYQYLGNLVGNNQFLLPQPMFNVLNGGKHADNGLNVQEYLIAPLGFDSFRRKVQAAAEVIAALRSALKAKGHNLGVGDEGGFAPALASNEEGLELLTQAIAAAGYSPATIKIGLDVAASELYREGAYHLKIAGVSQRVGSAELINWYTKLFQEYPLVSIEDGLAEDDWSGFASLRDALGEKVMVVGDDLTVTNVERIKLAAEHRAINSVLIKLNQIGTLTETVQAVQLTKQQGWMPFVSHRSGETTDTFIADLAVGLACPYLKAGSLARGERVCKYNRLMEIEGALKV